MGKLKRNSKNKKARVNPLRSNELDKKQDQKDENTRQSKILPLINKLKSVVPNDKSMALSVITVLCEDERMRKLLLKESLVNILMDQCLNDSNDEIVVESFGLLRNLGIEEGYEVIKFLWRSNIWTSIENALNKIETSFKYLETSSDSNSKQNDKAKIQLLYEFAENVLSLIVVLASGSDNIFDIILQKIDRTLNLVINLINWNLPQLKVSLKLLNALLEFIYEFSSESLEFLKKLSEIPAFDLSSILVFIDSPAQSSNRAGKVYTEGIKFNIYEGLGKINDKNQVCYEILSNLYNTITTIDLENLKNNLAPPDNVSEPTQNKDEINQEIHGESNEKSQARSDLTSLESSLDIISSILEYLAVSDSVDEPVSLSGELNSLLTTKIYLILIELLRFDFSNDGKYALMEKTLISINNLAWLFISSSTIPVNWFELIFNLWDTIIKISSNDNIILQKNCLNILWAITKSIGEEVRVKVNRSMIDSLVGKCEKIIQTIDDKDVDQLLNLEFFLSSIGFLGSLASVVGNITVTQQISEFLLHSIGIFSSNKSNTIHFEIVFECLNLVFDIFGDKDFDYDYEIFVKQNYLSRLAQLEPQVKEMYKSIDKNKHDVLKLQGEDAWTNLGRFIQYKETERS